MMCRMISVESVHSTLFSFLPVGLGQGNHTIASYHTDTGVLHTVVLCPGGNCSNK